MENNMSFSHLPSPPTGEKVIQESPKIITPPASLVTPVNSETQARTMSFPDAMRKVIDGKKVRRIAWGDVPDYGYLRDGWLTILRGETFHTWSVNDGDMSAEDWMLVD